MIPDIYPAMRWFLESARAGFRGSGGIGGFGSEGRRGPRGENSNGVLGMRLPK